ncbi:hypothetical protein QE152_g24528 [Popillia japonica]|uniref:Protein sleepless n=1 Tax=Popillia japonica TaxID=7064 RepID=A0AAW1KGB8_POPJA
MYHTIVLQIIVLVSIFNRGLGLSCYECIGPPNRGCAAADLSDFIKIRCTKSAFLQETIEKHLDQVASEDPKETSCVQALFVQNNATIAFRGCVSVPAGIDICKAASHVVDIKSCSACTENYCNKKAF